MSFRYLTVILCLGLLSVCSVHAGDATPLQERMSDAEFRAAGLHKLSEQELDRLNAFLSDQKEETAASSQQATTSLASAETSKASSETSPPEDVGFEDRRGNEREAFTARIEGEFSGWRGDTRFTLDNGQVWRQSSGGTFYYPGDDAPEVEFTPGLFGSWFMRVDGYNTKVRVKRVR